MLQHIHIYLESVSMFKGHTIRRLFLPNSSHPYIEKSRILEII
jgi:hypothetical protein